jgi:hypothetical protein
VHLEPIELIGVAATRCSRVLVENLRASRRDRNSSRNTTTSSWGGGSTSNQVEPASPLPKASETTGLADDVVRPRRMGEEGRTQCFADISTGVSLRFRARSKLRRIPLLLLDGGVSAPGNAHRGRSTSHECARISRCGEPSLPELLRQRSPALLPTGHTSSGYRLVGNPEPASPLPFYSKLRA